MAALIPSTVRAGLLLVLLLVLAGCAAQSGTAGPGAAASPSEVGTEEAAASTAVPTATPPPSVTPAPMVTPVATVTPPPTGEGVADEEGAKAHEDARRALEQARADWAAAGLSDYTYELTRSCFCPPELAGPWTVTVVDGQVTGVMAADGTEAPISGGPIEFGPVESVHDAIASMLASEPTSTTPSGRYDDVGLPVDLYVDPSPMMADEEATWSAALVDEAPAE